MRVPELDIMANAYYEREYGPSRKRVASSVDEDEENSTSSGVDDVQNGVSKSNPCRRYHKSAPSEASNPRSVVTEEAQAREEARRADKTLKVMREEEKADIAAWKRWALLRSGAIRGTDQEQVRLVVRKEREAGLKWVNGGKMVGLQKGPPVYDRSKQIDL